MNFKIVDSRLVQRMAAFNTYPFFFSLLWLLFGCQDAGFVPNGVPPFSEGMNGIGMNGIEVERRLSQSVSFFFFLRLLVCFLLSDSNKMNHNVNIYIYIYMYVCMYAYIFYQQKCIYIYVCCIITINAFAECIQGTMCFLSIHPSLHLFRKGKKICFFVFLLF